jgi:hypothetical protein
VSAFGTRDDDGALTARVVRARPAAPEPPAPAPPAEPEPIAPEQPEEAPEPERAFAKGVITSVTAPSFRLEHEDGGTLDVLTDDETAVRAGSPHRGDKLQGFAALEVGDVVKVKGTLTPEGTLVADMVVELHRGHHHDEGGARDRDGRCGDHRGDDDGGEVSGSRDDRRDGDRATYDGDRHDGDHGDDGRYDGSRYDGDRDGDGRRSKRGGDDS